MKALNSLVLISLSSLAVTGVVQADEPIKAQPQQQATIQSSTPQYQWVQTGRRQRWYPVPQNQSVVVQSPASSQQNTPAPAVQSSPNAATSPAKIIPVAQPPVIETRKPGLLSRLRGKRYQYSSISSTTPVIVAAPGSAQPLPQAK